MSKAPYGTWSSPITAEAITKGSNAISDVIVDPLTAQVYHIESRPSEKGRSVLVHTATGKDVASDKTWNFRTGVHEYGGSAVIVYGGTIYFSHYVDGKVYRIIESEGDKAEPVTPEEKPYRYAAFKVHPVHTHLLVSILEDHTIDEPSKIVTTLCIINTNTKTAHTLVSGADFYASPGFDSTGTHLTWMQWDHPDMPWEGAEVHVASVSVSGDEVSIHDNVHIAGKHEKVSAAYPSWTNDNTIVYTSDETGFMNPHIYDLKSGKSSPVLPEPIQQDFGLPMWILNFSPYAVLGKDGNRALWAALKNGRTIFYLLDLTGATKPQVVESPYVFTEVVHTVSAENEELVFVGKQVNESTSIVQCSLAGLHKNDFHVLKGRSESDPSFPDGIVSHPQPITLQFDGEPLHVVYYAPRNPDYSGSSIEEEHPPCVINIHGGPTGYTDQGLRWNLQYFTSRGWAWMDVNYGGSSGSGRRYIERLAGKWGIVDVNDAIRATRALAAAPYNLIDPNRAVIRGGSAGGFTVLACLSIVKEDDLKTFAAATSSYGVSDLKKLADFTHKFESQYLYKLVGGTVEEVPEVYRERSPIYYASRVVVPLLILQGDADRVVPKEQSEEIYESIKSRGGVVEYKLYSGEGHGWRRDETMCDALEREIGFYERILGLKN
ncbi:Alpha/Beta hydrolase protein [Cyathus striatus]|nr:Alpha/Beta hydrolase protein [Cyathus striatus]